MAQQAWDAGSGGGGVTLMPSLYANGSYAELQHQLHLLRDGSPSERRLWWHLTERYLRGAERLQRVECRRTRKGAVAVAPAHSEVMIVVEVGRRDALVRLRVWNTRVVDSIVAAGVRQFGVEDVSR